MKKKSRKRFSEIIILSILLFLIAILFVLNIIIVVLSKSKLKKRDDFNVNDIFIKYLKSFKFIEDTSKPFYGSDNLGSAGKLFLLCYTGKCSQEVEEEASDENGNHRTFIETIINHECSLQCFNLKGDTCNNCPSYKYYDSDGDEKIGICSQEKNGFYSSGKVCIADNVIYFWKGKKYKIDSFDSPSYTYLKDAKLKDEECPSNTKNCGILDDEENKLCIPLNSKCPPNVISTKKLNQSNYFSSEIDNETIIYYAYDENAINNKIIAGLYADTDIHINKEEEINNQIILDTYTISGFLKDNKDLYKGVDFGYNPYQMDNIDEKGKSFLKVSYNNKNPKLKSLKEKYNLSINNKKWNEKIANPAEKSCSLFFVGILFCGYALIFLIFCLICGINNKCKHLIGILLSVFCIFLELLIISIIGAFRNVKPFNKAAKFEKNGKYNNLRILNIIYIILGLLLLLLIMGTISLILYNSFNKNPQNPNHNYPENASNTTNSNIVFNDFQKEQCENNISN